MLTDAHTGLTAARQAVFGSVPWQRCQFHLQQNAGTFVPRQGMKAPVDADLRAIFTASDRQAVEALLRATVARYRQSAPKLAAWLEENLWEGLTIFAPPDVHAAHRPLLRRTNALERVNLERVNKEVKRRTRVASLFPSEASCLRLVSAVLMEISDEWQTDKASLTFANLNPEN